MKTGKNGRSGSLDLFYERVGGIVETILAECPTVDSQTYLVIFNKVLV